MTKASGAASVAVGVEAAAGHRLALRAIVVGSLVAATWILCSLLSTPASAHAAEAGAAPSSVIFSDDPEPDAGAQTDDGGMLGGLVGRVTERVTDVVRKPVKAVSEPVRRVSAPADSGAGKPDVPVVGELLPEQPRDEGGADPVRTLPMPAHEAGPPSSEPVTADGKDPATRGTPDVPPDARVPEPASASNSDAPTRSATELRSQFTERLARQAAALGLGSSDPLPDPDQQPNREQAPASPAPPTPTSKFNNAQSGGGERDLVATLPRNTAKDTAVSASGERAEGPHLGPAAPGLPAISPD